MDLELRLRGIDSELLSDVADSLRLPGFYRLVAEKYPERIPDMNNNQVLPRRLLQENGVAPIIINAYTPIDLTISLDKIKSNQDFQDLLRSEVKSVALRTRLQVGNVNAFFMESIGYGVIVPNFLTQECNSASISRKSLVSAVVNDLMILDADSWCLKLAMYYIEDRESVVSKTLQKTRLHLVDVVEPIAAYSMM